MSSQQQQRLHNVRAATDKAQTALCILAHSYKENVRLIREEYSQIEKRHDELNHRREELVQNHGGSNVNDDDVLEINAGGVPMTGVTRGILTQKKGTKLEALFNGRWEDKLQRDSDGRIFLDVNPVFWERIVDYLNELKLSPPDFPPNLPQVDREDQIYLDQLMMTLGLIDVSSRIAEMDTKILDDPKHIKALYGFLSEDKIEGELELLYRGSRDGFGSNDFHSKCDNKGPTVTIIKDVGGYLFGGFAGASWKLSDSGSGWEYVSCDKAFLFALHCYAGLEPTKMRIRPEKTDKALYCHGFYGPAFSGPGPSDLLVRNNCNTSNGGFTNIGNTFEHPPGQDGKMFLTGNKNFMVSEIEVFKFADTNKSNSPSFDDSTKTGESTQPVASKQWQTATFDDFPEPFKNSLVMEQEELLLAKSELQKLQLALDKEESFINHFASGETKDIITFNVRRKAMETKRSTLAIFEDSVLAKQFCDPLWASKEDNSDDGVNGITDWDSSKVSLWVDGISSGLSTDAIKIIKEQVHNGVELLSLEPHFLAKMGITRPALQAVVMKEIKDLRKRDSCDDDSTTLSINHSSYCFEKMLDHLRFHALSSKAHGGDPKSSSSPPPTVKNHERKKFKECIEYYFPNDIESFISSLE